MFNTIIYCIAQGGEIVDVVIDKLAYVLRWITEKWLLSLNSYRRQMWLIMLRMDRSVTAH